MDNEGRKIYNECSDRIMELENAIRNHRDQKDDDRCWLDDAELYKHLPEGEQSLNVLPPKDIFLKNCERYHQSRQPNNLPYAPVHVRELNADEILNRMRELDNKSNYYGVLTWHKIKEYLSESLKGIS